MSPRSEGTLQPRGETPLRRQLQRMQNSGTGKLRIPGRNGQWLRVQAQDRGGFTVNWETKRGQPVTGHHFESEGVDDTAQRIERMLESARRAAAHRNAQPKAQTLGLVTQVNETRT